MGSCVVDMEHRQIKLLFACKRLILVENQDEIYLWFDAMEPVSTVWAVLFGLMNRKTFPRLSLLEMAGEDGKRSGLKEVKSTIVSHIWLIAVALFRKFVMLHI